MIKCCWVLIAIGKPSFVRSLALCQALKYAHVECIDDCARLLPARLLTRSLARLPISHKEQLLRRALPTT